MPRRRWTTWSKPTYTRWPLDVLAVATRLAWTPTWRGYLWVICLRFWPIYFSPNGLKIYFPTAWNCAPNRPKPTLPTTNIQTRNMNVLVHCCWNLSCWPTRNANRHQCVKIMNMCCHLPATSCVFTKVDNEIKISMKTNKMSFWCIFVILSFGSPFFAYQWQTPVMTAYHIYRTDSLQNNLLKETRGSQFELKTIS